MMVKKFKKFKHKRYLIYGVVMLFYIPIMIMMLSPTKSHTTASGEPPDLSSMVNNSNNTPAEKENDLVQIIKEYVTLPQDEKPYLATVTDPSLLQDQDFFRKSKNGDKVLIYKKAKLAVLYRPSTKEVITYAEAEFNLDTPTPTKSGN